MGQPIQAGSKLDSYFSMTEMTFEIQPFLSQLKTKILNQALMFLWLMYITVLLSGLDQCP